MCHTKKINRTDNVNHKINMSWSLLYIKSPFSEVQAYLSFSLVAELSTTPNIPNGHLYPNTQMTMKTLYLIPTHSVKLYLSFSIVAELLCFFISLTPTKQSNTHNFVAENYTPLKSVSKNSDWSSMKKNAFSVPWYV